MSLDLSSIVPQFDIKMANLRHKTIYEFENFRLDAEHLMLFQNGQEISLAPKVIETLLALVERRGEVIGKDELMQLVWTDSIVEEGNLSQNLYLLRKTLGDGKNGKPLIETLRRRGYRFVAEVRRVETAEANAGTWKFRDTEMRFSLPQSLPISGCRDCCVRDCRQPDVEGCQQARSGQQG